MFRYFDQRLVIFLKIKLKRGEICAEKKLKQPFSLEKLAYVRIKKYLCSESELSIMFEFLFGRRELLPIPYKREIHCHLIPGVDDGSQSLDFSMEALTALQRFGVERVIFSPHHTAPNFMNSPENIGPLYEQVKQEVANKNLAIKCEDYSFEYRVDSSFLEMMQTGKWGEPACKIRPLKGNYLLIENGWRNAIPGLDEVIARLQADGYYLIMAHPERYHYYAGMHGKYYHHLQEMGVEFQCNILSFAGYYGEVEKKMAYWMLEHGYVNFLGSDMHNKQHIELLEKFLRSKDYATIKEDLEDSINNDQMG